MANSISDAIALDYLRGFSPTSSISKYSPRAADIAHHARLAFKAPDGGLYPLTADDIITATKKLELARNATTGQVGISAEQFNARLGCSVFSHTDVCVHGFCPYTFAINDIAHTPERRFCCPRCPGGFTAPTPEQVAQAKHWLTHKPKIGTAPTAGSLIVAARELGLAASKPIDATFQIQRR